MLRPAQAHSVLRWKNTRSVDDVAGSFIILFRHLLFSQWCFPASVPFVVGISMLLSGNMCRMLTVESVARTCREMVNVMVYYVNHLIYWF